MNSTSSEIITPWHTSPSHLVTSLKLPTPKPAAQIYKFAISYCQMTTSPKHTPLQVCKPSESASNSFRSLLRTKISSAISKRTRFKSDSADQKLHSLWVCCSGVGTELVSAMWLWERDSSLPNPIPTESWSYTQKCTIQPQILPSSASPTLFRFACVWLSPCATLLLQVKFSDT